MAANTAIEWATHTFNPWWGCTKVSPGCLHCYADTHSARFKQNVFGANAPRRFFGDGHWAEPRKWDRKAAAAGVRERVFCGSMCDVFEDRPDLAPHRARLLDLIVETPHLDWLLLTKRPENARRLGFGHDATDWPVNVWLGTSVEDQRRADERIPELLAVPAALRFLSCEPLLGPVDLIPPLKAWAQGKAVQINAHLHWLIVGGESGPGARPMHLGWARGLVDQCRQAAIAPFVKQLGARPVYGVPPREEHRVRVTGKGGDPAEWPEDLRVREIPDSPAAAWSDPARLGV